MHIPFRCLLLCFLLVGCKPQKPQKPVRENIDIKKEYLLRFNEIAITVAQKQIKAYIKKDTHHYINSGNGFYYVFVKRTENKCQKKKIIERVFDLKNDVLSHKKIIHLRANVIRSASFPTIYRQMLPKINVGDSLKIIANAFVADGIGTRKIYRTPIVIQLKVN